METVLRFAPKQPRTSAPKVRTGCATCKTRRIKCDEEKPRCGRCAKGDRKCEYKAATPITRNRPKTKTQTIVSKSRNSLAPIHPRLPLVCAPSTSIGDGKEQMFFQLFRDRIADDLGGTFEMPFFTRLVLRECHSQPVIKDFVLAISGLCRSFSSRAVGEKDEEHLQFALVHQNKALHALRNTLTEESNQIRLAVIASGLLHSYESLQGNWETARQQLVSGEKLLRSWQETKNSNSDRANMYPQIDPELFFFFPRLEVGLLSYAAMNPGITDSLADEDEKPIQIEEFPESFENFIDARKSMIRLICLSFQFLRKVHRRKRLKVLPFPDYILHEPELISTAFDSWKHAFEPFSRMEKIQQHPGFLMFSIALRICRIAASMSLEWEETAHDQFTFEFQESIKDARGAVMKEMRFKTYTKLQSIIGVAMPLFYIATRCRVPSVRREAIAIIRDFPARQGVWNTYEALQVTEWVMAVEEEGLDEDGFVPEQWRIRMHTLKWTREGETIHVEGMQGAFDGEWTLRKGALQLW